LHGDGCFAGERGRDDQIHLIEAIETALRPGVLHDGIHAADGYRGARRPGGAQTGAEENQNRRVAGPPRFRGFAVTTPALLTEKTLCGVCVTPETRMAFAAARPAALSVNRPGATGAIFTCPVEPPMVTVAEPIATVAGTRKLTCVADVYNTFASVLTPFASRMETDPAESGRERGGRNGSGGGVRGGDDGEPRRCGRGS